MPKWLSSLMIFIGFIALVAIALLPRNIEVTVTTNVKQASSNTTSHNHHGMTDSLNDPAVAAPRNDEDNDE